MIPSGSCVARRLDWTSRCRSHPFRTQGGSSRKHRATRRRSEWSLRPSRRQAQSFL